MSFAEREGLLVPVHRRGGCEDDACPRLAGREQHVQRPADVDVGGSLRLSDRARDRAHGTLVVHDGASIGGRPHRVLVAEIGLDEPHLGTPARFSSLPSERSSRPTTSCPSATRRRQRCEPMNPAAPVTSILIAVGSPH